MATLLFLISLIVIVVIYRATRDECTIIMPTMICFGLAIVVAISMCNVIGDRVIDSKIAMYQEENKNIETQMDVLVEKYMNYESETLGELKGESSITLVSLYPELKADELVKQQVSVYTSNNSLIKELREKKINLPTWKWWLYFGK